MNHSRRTAATVGLFAAIFFAVGCAGGGARKEAEKTVKSMDPSQKIRLARSYFNAGKTGQAMEVLEEAQKSFPGDASILNYYGQLSLLTGKLQQAEEAMLEVLKRNPYMTDAHNTLGAVYQEMGRYNDAEREYRTTLEDRSYATPQKVYLNLGLLYSAQDREEEAIAMLRKAVEADPRYFDAHYRLAGALAGIGNNREAAREYEVAKSAFNGSGEYHYRYGLVLMKLGDKPAAAEHFRRVIELSPGSENSARADELLEILN